MNNNENKATEAKRVNDDAYILILFGIAGVILLSAGLYYFTKNSSSQILGGAAFVILTPLVLVIMALNVIKIKDAFVIKEDLKESIILLNDARDHGVFEIAILLFGLACGTTIVLHLVTGSNTVFFLGAFVSGAVVGGIVFLLEEAIDQKVTSLEEKLALREKSSNEE